MVLAGGRGERLRPLTETRPKPLLPILGEPVICRQLRMALSAFPAGEVVIVYSYLGDEIVKSVRECGVSASRITFVDQGEALGTAHALLRVVEEVGEDDMLVVYADVYLDESAVNAIASLRPPGILVGRTKTPWEYGVVEVREDGVVESIKEKPPREKAPPEADVLVGVIMLRGEDLHGLREVRKSPRGEYEITDLLAALAARGELTAARLPDPYAWRDIGRPWDLLLANRLALEMVEGRVSGEVHRLAVVDDNVVVEEGAYVGPHTVVEGPSYIGPGAQVGPGVHIRPYTVILAGAKVGFASEVKASILLEHAKAPHLNYVGDSILGEHVNLGAGTVTANLRFDGRTVKMTIRGERVDTGLRKLGAVIGGHAQTGINVSIMPGVKIGSYAVVYPGCVVNRDVPRGAVYRCW